jgi:hypothetical protein
VAVLDPSTPTIMQVGAGAMDTPWLELLLGSVMHGAEHGVQASLACQYSPVHCGALHCDTIGGAVSRGHLEGSTTREVLPMHCTLRVLKLNTPMPHWMMQGDQAEACAMRKGRR